MCAVMLLSVQENSLRHLDNHAAAMQAEVKLGVDCSNQGQVQHIVGIPGRRSSSHACPIHNMSDCSVHLLPMRTLNSDVSVFLSATV